MGETNRYNGHLVIVMAKEHYNPLSVIRSLGKSGINPIYIAIQGKGEIASSSKYISKCHYAYSVSDGYQILLQEYGNEEVPPFVLCTDDYTIGYLDNMYSEIKDKFIAFNAQKNGRIHEYMDKYNVLQLAKQCGLKTLETVCVNRGEIPANLNYPIITKAQSPLSGGWKADVFICYNEQELKKAYASIQSPKVILQRYIEKKNEYCLEGFSINHGEDSFFAISVTYNYLLKDYYSPYLTVGKADNIEINSALSKMMAIIGFEGIFEIEFLIDQNGEYYFDEINFRNSPWSYPATYLGANIPKLWMESMLTQTITLEPFEIPSDFTAMIEPVDYAKRVESGMIPFSEWLSDFKNSNVTFYHDEDDLEPYYLMMENREFYS